MIRSPKAHISALSRAAAVAIGTIVPTTSTVTMADPPNSNNYTTFVVSAGSSVQLGYYASAKKDCSPAALPTIRVIEAPRLGTFTVRRGVLTINSVASCPGLKAPAQVTFYAARPGPSGKDHLIYEVTNADGQVNVFDVTIEVKEPPKPDLRAGKGEPI